MGKRFRKFAADNYYDDDDDYVVVCVCFWCASGHLVIFSAGERRYLMAIVVLRN